MTSKTISTVYKSLVRSVQDLIDDVLTIDDSAQYYAWESRDSEDQMPQTTLIGLDGYSFHENRGLWVIRCGLTISTYNDANLLTESEILDMAIERFGEDKKVNLLNDKADVITQLVVSNFDLMPMGQSELRNYRTIGLELKRTQEVDA